jgi:HlyD family secretion protein
MMIKFRRRLLYLLVALLVVGGLVYGFRPKPVPVSLAEAVTEPLEVTIDDEGRTRIRERYVIRSPILGYAERVTLDAGDPVQAGQTIAVLRPPQTGVLDPAARAQTEAQVAAARAALQGERERLAAAKADAKYASAERERMQQLFQDGAVSQQALDQARTAAARADANVEAARQAVRAAEKQVEAARTALVYAGKPPGEKAPRVTLTSPVAGNVLQVVQDSEGPVQPGQVLLSVGDPRDLEVVVDLLSEQAVRIEPGTPVRIRAWGGGEALRGKVKYVEPQAFTKVSALGVEEQRVNVVVSVDEVPPSLGDNYRIVAEFITWAAEGVLQVPRNAVFPYGDSHAVYAVVDGKAELRRVKIGRQNGLRTQILDGLRKGDAVIAHPDERIEDGVKVEAQPVSEATPRNASEVPVPESPGAGS